MRALQAGPGMRLRFTDVPAPAPPGPGAAIVHPIACSTCDLDCAIALGATQFALPLHIGHECVAEVLTVGERVTSVRPGDRVIVDGIQAVRPNDIVNAKEVADDAPAAGSQ